MQFKTTSKQSYNKSLKKENLSEVGYNHTTLKRYLFLWEKNHFLTQKILFKTIYNHKNMREEFSANGVRSISSEVRSDLVVHVNETRYLLHKFPLLSKCVKLQRLCSENPESSHLQITQLHDIPGGSKAFELCAKFCYGITITISAYNIVSALCAAKYLQMTEDVEKGNLVHKLEVFFNSCILNGWKDCIVTLQTTKPFKLQSEELGITTRCIESVVSKVISNPSKVSLSHNQNGEREVSDTNKKWWGEDISELRIDLYWRTMATLKSGGKVPANLISDALKIYTSKWLPKISRNLQIVSSSNGESELESSNANASRLLLESIITLLPMETNSVSCSFLLKLLKAANVLQASASSRLELARRVALQLDEAKFMLQKQSQKTSPLRTNGDRECQESSRSSSSTINGSMVKVAKLVDGYLQEISRDVNVPLSKFISLGESIPELARLNHDDLYRAIDVYLKSHPDLTKSERKHLCRTLDCKKLSFEACMHAAQNEFLPLRVVVQVLFFEHTRAAMANGHLTGLPGNIKALLAAKGNGTSPHGSETVSTNMSTPQGDHEQWVKPTKSRMKIAVDENPDDGSSCLVPRRRMFSRLWLMNRSEIEIKNKAEKVVNCE
ncbi:unnamed protein product [Lactuca saligna]|uniref:NPH3 domain-containing protein n=1 Tax=Lactuca saligna TaxID=75948 RepID=A0AA36DXH5_LACSI|nr:unnamed protein product [Lactuca saligna]